LAAIDSSAAAARSIAPTIAAQEISVLTNGFTFIGPSKTPPGSAGSSAIRKRFGCAEAVRREIGCQAEVETEVNAMAILNFLAYNQNVNRKRNGASPRSGSAFNPFTRILHPQEFKTIWIVPDSLLDQARAVFATQRRRL
jgi:hypothetical protein